tara:strand:+ start:625 stop:744 length:120 start_codon:yes stop_codon:yes gene_type:complete
MNRRKIYQHFIHTDFMGIDKKIREMKKKNMRKKERDEKI